MRDAVGDRGIDRVLGDVALDPEIVAARAVAGQRAALLLHLVGGLPRADDDLADAAHGLAVRRHHRERAEVMQDVFGGDRLPADAALREGDVLGDRRSRWWHTISMSRCSSSVLTREGPRRVGRARQHIGQAGDADDVRRMAAAGTLGVKGMDRAALEGGDRVFDEARLVQRVGMDRDLHVELVGDARQQSIAGGVVPQSSCSLRPHAPAAPARRAAGCEALPLPKKPRLIGKPRPPRACDDVPGSRRAGRRGGAGRRAGAAAEHRGDARGKRVVDLLRADEMDMRVDAAGRDDLAFAGDDLGAGADGDVDAGLNVGLPALPISAMRPSLRPISALTMPQWSMMTALVMTVSTAPCARLICLWPMPSRMTLPPPNFTSSP